MMKQSMVNYIYADILIIYPSLMELKII